jgi:hypothetical protein
VLGTLSRPNLVRRLRDVRRNFGEADGLQLARISRYRGSSVSSQIEGVQEDFVRGGGGDPTSLVLSCIASVGGRDLRSTSVPPWNGDGILLDGV